MRPPLLDSRLSAAMDMVRVGSVAADVGTDHGKLAFWLAASGRCPHVYATDLRTAPLQKAQELICRHGLSGQVTCLLGDGLSPLSPDKVDDIVMAGMGGETIAQIIEKAPWVKNAVKRLILVPTTGHAALRKYLCEAGFAIQAECAVEAGGRYYAVLQAVYEGLVREADEMYALIGTLTPVTPEGRGYIEKVLHVLQKKLREKQKSNRFSLEEQRALMQKLEEVLATCPELKTSQTI